MFKEVEFNFAFYDDFTEEVFYCFKTQPQIDHGDWAISSGGDAAFDLLNDRVYHDSFPPELVSLMDYIPEKTGLEDEDV